MVKSAPVGGLAVPPTSVMVVLGTRPEAIKLAPVVRMLGDAADVVYTGQHYDEDLGNRVLEDLAFGAPHHQLDVGGKHRGHQIGVGTAELTDRMLHTRPSAVVVQGDTNAGLAGALAANATQVPLVHIEAGLRSFDRAMPEEHNRVLIDHLADLCAAPTELNGSNLRAEGIGDDRISITGNTIVEAVANLLPTAEVQRAELERRDLRQGEYVIATLHRPENVDDIHVLREILAQLAECEVPVVLPLHPRARARLVASGMEAIAQKGAIRAVEPLAPTVFLSLSAGAAVWVTDSGGLQEEATILKRRALVVRRSTERPEALGSFSKLIDYTVVGPYLAEELARPNDDLSMIESPFGDGDASARIVAAIATLIGRMGPAPL